MGEEEKKEDNILKHVGQKKIDLYSISLKDFKSKICPNVEGNIIDILLDDISLDESEIKIVIEK